MERRDFLLNSCRACLGLLAVPAIASMESCSSSKGMGGMTEANGTITLPIADIADKPGVTLHPKSIADPLLVAKQPDGSYVALVLKCPHKGGPLSVVGDQLDCDWHHSAFDMQGNVVKGPAKSGLTKYPVVVEGDKLRIKVA